MAALWRSQGFTALLVTHDVEEAVRLASRIVVLTARPAAVVEVIEVPTGVGAENAPVAFRADFTYATGIVKEPVLRAAAAPSVGRLRYLDLGFFDAAEPSLVHQHALTADVLDPLRELRPAGCDKRTFGHLLIVAGSRAMPGAALMATLAALRSGVGLVTAVVPESVAAALAARAP